MRIGFIGAGKVATAFGRYLRSRGLTISGYHDRHEDKMIHAGELTGGRACRDSRDRKSVV
jgi:3-hydroxyisobutyrate dehydrogenase-like beta-hydroxyacid dehydrogenase